MPVVDNPGLDIHKSFSERGLRPAFDRLSYPAAIMAMAQSSKVVRFEDLIFEQNCVEGDGIVTVRGDRIGIVASWNGRSFPHYNTEHGRAR